MPLIYKIDVLAKLKDNGYTTYKLRSDNLLSQGAIQSLRTNKPISWANIEKICALLSCDIGDIMRYIPDDNDRVNADQ